MEGSHKLYKHIRVDGTVSVKLVEHSQETTYHKWSNTFLLLGPTGAGKSAFIEALASDPSLQISSHQLEGFTQKISTYQLVNATRRNTPIYILDVPGFADTKLSEMGIVSMLREYMNKNQFQPLDRILYLTPINNPRLPGSHRKVLRTFQALTGVQTAKSVVIVTTMWDCVWGKSATKRAEDNFSQLRDDIWKDYMEGGSRIVKFQNTQESAMSVLSDAFDEVSGYNFEFRDMKGSSRISRNAAFASNIQDDLRIRIQNLGIQKRNIQSELQAATAHSDEQLKSVLSAQLGEVQKPLAKFEQELKDFESDPDPVITPLLPGTSTPDPGNPLDGSPTRIPTNPDSRATPSRRLFTRLVDSAKCLGGKLRWRREDQ